MWHHDDVASSVSIHFRHAYEQNKQKHLITNNMESDFCQYFICWERIHLQSLVASAMSLAAAAMLSVALVISFVHLTGEVAQSKTA
jgi:hypothetical protein